MREIQDAFRVIAFWALAPALVFAQADLDAGGAMAQEDLAIGDAIEGELPDAGGDDDLFAALLDDGDDGDAEPIADDDLFADLLGDTEATDDSADDGGDVLEEVPEADLFDALDEPQPTTGEKGGPAPADADGDDLLDMLSDDSADAGDDDLLGMLGEEPASADVPVAEAADGGDDDLLGLLDVDTDDEIPAAADGDDDDLLGLLGGDTAGDTPVGDDGGDDDLLGMLEDEPAPTDVPAADVTDGGDDDLLGLLGDDAADDMPVADDGGDDDLLGLLGDDAADDMPVADDGGDDDLLGLLGDEPAIDEGDDAASDDDLLGLLAGDDDPVVEDAPADDAAATGDDDLLGLLTDDLPDGLADDDAAPSDDMVELVEDPPAFVDDRPLDDDLISSLVDETATEAGMSPIDDDAQDASIEALLSRAEEDVVDTLPVAPDTTPSDPMVDDTVPAPVDDDPIDGLVGLEPEPEMAPPVREVVSPEVSSFAVQERLRRIAQEEHGLQSMRMGDKALAEGNAQKAIMNYQEALRYIPERADRDAERVRSREGLATAFYLQALSFERMGELDKALAAAVEARRYGLLKGEEVVRRIKRKQDGGPVVGAPKPRRRWQEESYLKQQEEIAKWMKQGREAYLAGEYQSAYDYFGSVLKRDRENKEAIRMMRMCAQRMYDRSSMEVEATRTKMMAQVRDTWNPRDYGYHETPVDDNLPRSRTEPTQELERKRILDKMERIRIPEIEFRQANIRDVVDFLHQQSVEQDPTAENTGRRGVNFILKLGDDGPASGGGGGGGGGGGADPFGADPFGADPFATGGGAAESTGGGAGSDNLVTFSALDITLKEALDIVVDIAQLKYRIRGSVVMVVPFDQADSEVILRMYDVLPTVADRFRRINAALSTGSGGGNAGGFGGGGFGGGGNGLGEISAGGGASGDEGQEWKSLFLSLGVQWPANSSIRYVEAIGKLVVANTADNLAKFERVLAVLNVVPYQIEIEARFVEVQQNDVDSLGLEWLLTDSWEIAENKGDAALPLAARRRLVMNANGGANGFTKGNRFLTRNPVGGSTIADDVMSVSAMLTNPELTVVLHALQQRGHTDLLSAPKITTKSGQEASIRVVTEYIYPTEFETEGIGDSGGNNNNNNANQATIGAVVTPSSFEMREVGVILNVTPRVTPEGQMIDLDMRPQVVSEPTFRNYGSTYTSFDPNGNPITQELNMEQPFFHVRQMQTSMLMYNGATVVMGGMITETRVDVDDKIPLLGDLPIIGRLFRSQYESSEKRNLLIFVTARLVDPAGRPLDQASLTVRDDVIADAISDGGDEAAPADAF